MSQQIPVAFEQKFAADFMLLSQQKGSRLRGTVRDDPTPGAKFFHFDRIGRTAMVKKTSRHQDTPTVDTPHSRRRVSTDDFVWADLIDRADINKMMTSPQNSYMTSGMYAAGRQIDDLIIAAARGDATAIDAVDASTAIPLPAAQKIAVGGTGLTLAKILQVKEIMDAAEVDEMDRVFVYSAKQGTNLLNTTEIKSADFNSVKALVNGQLNSFLGFTWIRSERLPKVSNDRFCLAYQRRGVGLYVNQDITTRISERPDKNYSVQCYVELAMGATRIEDEAVVEIACLES